jgi:hypothetical protein
MGVGGKPGGGVGNGRGPWNRGVGGESVDNVPAGSTDHRPVRSPEVPSGVGAAAGRAVWPRKAVPPVGRGGSGRSQPGRVIIGNVDGGGDTDRSLSGDSVSADCFPDGRKEASTWAPQVRQNHCSGMTLWPFRQVGAASGVTLHSLEQGHSLWARSSQLCPKGPETHPGTSGRRSTQ